jgi:hypothetical protein
MEIYDREGAFVTAGRRYIEVAAWGSRDWLREQATHPWDLPAELQDAPERTLWGKPVESSEPPKPPPAPTPVREEVEPWLVEVHFTDEEPMPQKLLIREIPVVTEGGSVRVPVEGVHQIDFAPRSKRTNKPSKKSQARDVLWTTQRQITGLIEGELWEVRYPDFTTNLVLADVRRIVRRVILEDEEPAMKEKRELVVMGRTDGLVYGTNPYTLDSCVGTAAVHAGLLQEGEVGAVRVEIVASPSSFEGSTENGVCTDSWDEPAEGAFRIARGKGKRRR